jgi:hypothetical protein
MSNISNRRPASVRKEIVCFECLDGNHLQCNGDHERCDCWECLEQEINDGYLDESEDD